MSPNPSPLKKPGIHESASPNPQTVNEMQLRTGRHAFGIWS